MFANAEQIVTKRRALLQIVWRNPLSWVQAHLKVEEANNPYCRWAEQAEAIRVRRINWHSKHIWAR